jgi:hypothetical protein
MQTAIQHTHSFIPYLLIPILFLTLIVALAGFGGKRPFKGFTKTLAMVGLMLSHITLILGLILYFAKGWYEDIGSKMKVAEARFFAVEHITAMLFGIVLITIGYSKAKRANSHESAHKKLFWFYAMGFILILSRIPWKQWLS